MIQMSSQLKFLKIIFLAVYVFLLMVSEHDLLRCNKISRCQNHPRDLNSRRGEHGKDKVNGMKEGIQNVKKFCSCFVSQSKHSLLKQLELYFSNTFCDEKIEI